MKRTLYLSVILLALGYSASVKAEASKVDLGAPESGMRAEMIDVTAKVVDIDYTTRKVTLEDAGGTLTVRIDDAVENLKNVKKGDKVAIQYQQIVSWKLLKKKVKPTETVSKTITTEPGQKKPDVTRMTETTIIATIKSIDKQVPSVTLKEPDGEPFTIKIRNPAVLEGVKVGNQVELTYMELLAAKVEKVKK